MQCYGDIMSVAAQDSTVSDDLRSLGERMRNQAISGLRMFESINETTSPTSESRAGDSNHLRQMNPSVTHTNPSSPPQARRGVSAFLLSGRSGVLLPRSEMPGVMAKFAKGAMLHLLRNGGEGH